MKQDLNTALKADGLEGAVKYITHAREHKVAILANHDRVRSKADGSWPRALGPDQVAGAKKRLAEYDDTLAQYEADFALWEPLQKVLDAARVGEEVSDGS